MDIPEPLDNQFTIYSKSGCPNCKNVKFFLQEKKPLVSKAKTTTTFLSFLSYWKKSPVDYRKLLLGLLAFTLFTSSDVFLLLKAKQAGISDTAVIGIYIFYNLVYAIVSYPLGNLSDRIGYKKVYILGLLMFAIVYIGIGFVTNLYEFLILFFVYGIYAAATEGISKAWISNIADKNDTATAIGTYASFQSVCTLLASTLAGLIWYNFGPAATFLVSGIAAVCIILYFVFFVKKQRQNVVQDTT
jgi:MFS family permease